MNKLKKLIMMANQSRVPLGFEELKYIENDGAQYINTGIIPENGCWVSIDSQKMSSDNVGNAMLFGASAGSNGKSSFHINDYTPKQAGGGYKIQPYFRYGQNDVYRPWIDTNAFPFLRKTFFMDSKGFRITSDTGIYIEESFTKDADFSQNTVSLALFCLLRADGSLGYPYPGRIYEYIYGVNAEERIHLIPALRKADSKPGMYDLVSGQFFVNQGTGEFTYQ